MKKMLLMLALFSIVFGMTGAGNAFAHCGMCGMEGSHEGDEGHAGHGKGISSDSEKDSIGSEETVSQ